MKGIVLKKAIFLIVLLGLFGFFMLYGKLDPELFKGLKPRCIGPATMSGRISVIEVVPDQTDVIYVGTATGGLWKSLNGGITWTSIFDQQPVSSIGAVQVFAPNPNIVWVGTGEANPRNSVGVGRGVYKSLDGGKTWLSLGLEKTEKISRLLLHPSNPDIAFVAALGTTWGENPDRGVFKTMDGGKTWQKVLFVDEKSGAADLVMEPGNPNKLIAAIWEHRRWPWFFNSGGPGSGMFITVDGGATWKKITAKEGLPEGNLGRMGLAFARNKTNVVYALVEAKEDALLRSEDGGFTWKTVNTERGINGRAFYYCDIRVNPVNENIVYSLQTDVRVSEDGGKTFTTMANFAQSHSDYHAMWNHPDGNTLWVGNDGGVVLTRDRGKNWQFMANLPVGQFYHVSTDQEFPYNVYGGLQDNGSWRGPSSVLYDRGIYGWYWRMVGFGDGFDTEPDPQDSACGYAMSQGGELMYFNVRTGINQRIRPTESEIKHRYNWNAGLAIDPFEPATIYYGSQFVHKSTDKGKSWEIISPDLTTNDPEKQKQAASGGLSLDVTHAENHTTIVSITPSPLQKGLIWVGTDDGQVQLTRDGGKNWELVSLSLTGDKAGKQKKSPVPFGTAVPHVEASPLDAATAFVVFDDHRRSNWTSYVFVTRDYGKTWKSLVTPEIDGFAHIIKQDRVNPHLLFLGTEFGLYVSFNGGVEWMRWQQGFPTVPVLDMQIHPREDDLIIGTHGRAAYILDDITPLREFSPALLEKELHLFSIHQTMQYRSTWAPAFISPGDATFYGTNRELGALITFYWQPKKEEEPKETAEAKEKKEPKEGKAGKSALKVEVLDKENRVIRELEVKPELGINRMVWDLRQKAFARPGAPQRMMRPEGGGLYVLPGTYTVRFSYKGQEQKQNVTVLPDPRLKYDETANAQNFALATEIGGWFNAWNEVYTTLDKTKTILKTVTQFAENLEEGPKKEILDQSAALEKKITEFSKKVFRDREQKGITDNTDLLISKMYELYSMVSDTVEPLSQPVQVKYQKVKPEVEALLKEANVLLGTDVENFKKALEKCGFSLFKPFKPIEFKSEQK